MYCTRSNDYNSLRLLNPHPRNESIHSIKHMQQWFEMISVQVGQKCLWLEMTATHVFMWEWLEDKLLFNSVLIGSGVIALCFFSSPFFCKAAIAYRCCCRVRMDDRLWFFRGWGKKQTKRTVFVWSLPLTTSPLPSFLGELAKISSPPSFFEQHYSLCITADFTAFVSMRVYREEDN